MTWFTQLCAPVVGRKRSRSAPFVVLDRHQGPTSDGNIQLVASVRCYVDGTATPSSTDAKALQQDHRHGRRCIGDERGPKIVIQKFKNKTGYKKRQGHRQELTRVKITSIQ